MRRWFLLAGLLLTIQVAMAAEVYKCTDGEGAVSYSDEPCGPADRTRTLNIETIVPPGGPATAPICGAAGDWRQGELPTALEPMQRAALGLMRETPRVRGRPARLDRWRLTEALHACWTGRDGELVERALLPDGTIIEFRDGIRSLLNDPRSRSALVLRCQAVFDDCLDSEGLSGEACIVEIPTCTASPPWADGAPCCPAACKSSYADIRREGLPPKAALAQALAAEPSCLGASGSR
jgi:hypothetical protein